MKTIEEIREFTNQNPTTWVATSVGDQPHPLATFGGDETRQLLLKQLFANLNQQERNQIRAEIISFFHFRATQDRNLPISAQVQTYLTHLEELVAIDLDAIIPTFLTCLHDQDFSELVTSEVRYLCVDEFQDVNRAQYDLVTTLADTAEVFAIGDPDQAIYGFRGSDLRFFFQFVKDKNIYLRGHKFFCSIYEYIL